jgi:hypothetical protein
MPTYYWYDDAIFHIGGEVHPVGAGYNPGWNPGWGTTSSKGGKSSTSWGSVGGGKAEKADGPVWWGSSTGGKARKMAETTPEVIVENGSGKPRRFLNVGKADKDGLRIDGGKAEKQNLDLQMATDRGEDDAVFFAYEMQTAMPTGYHTVS